MTGADNQSLAQVCRWLESQEVSPTSIAGAENNHGRTGKWWPRRPWAADPAILPTWAEAWYDARTQQTHMCEALVDAHAWKMAGKALDARPARGPVLRENRCALSGATRCWSCGGPLYRIRAGHGNTHLYLRCAGTGPDRRWSRPDDPARCRYEALANEVIGGLVQNVYEITEVPGNEAELDARLAGLDYERRQVALRGLSWDAEDAERARIRAEYERVSAAERIPAPAIRPTDVTYGQRWRSLGTDGRAEWASLG